MRSHWAYLTLRRPHCLRTRPTVQGLKAPGDGPLAPIHRFAPSKQFETYLSTETFDVLTAFANDSSGAFAAYQHTEFEFTLSQCFGEAEKRRSFPVLEIYDDDDGDDLPISSLTFGVARTVVSVVVRLVFTLHSWKTRELW